MQEQYQLAAPSVYRQLIDATDDQEHCRWVGSPEPNSDKWKWFPVGQTQDQREVATYRQFHFDYSARDSYISPNQFFGWRTAKLLSKLHTNWLEIDTKAHSVLDADGQRSVIDDVLSQLTDISCPPPTCYVTSGSGGVHLYWIYEGIAAYPKHRVAWKAVTRALGKMLKGGVNWKVDFNASNNPAGMMRLPGTCHTKSGRYAKIFTGGPRYQFSELANTLSVSFEEQKPPPVVALQTTTTKPQLSFELDDNSVSSSPGRHTMRQWWTRIYWEVVKHLRRNRVKEGERDLALFILYVAQRHIHQHEEDAYQQICELNDSLIGLSQDQVESYLSTARVTEYRYKKDTLADYLSSAFQMNVDFLYESDHVRLSDEERRLRQQFGAKKSATEKRQKTMLLLTDHYIAFKSDSGKPPTQKQLAETAAKSLSTVKRHWLSIQDAAKNESIVPFQPDDPVTRILYTQAGAFQRSQNRWPSMTELETTSGFTLLTIQKHWTALQRLISKNSSSNVQGVISSSSIYPPKGDP